MSKLWGGRFSKTTSKIVDDFNASIAFDSRLWEHDIQGSIAHARMLGKCGIILAEDSETIVRGLESLSAEIGVGKVEFDVSAEDIHMNIEKLLHERIGEVAGKLHTARSRNDQVALDLRMYVKAQIGEVDAALKDLQDVLLQTAEDHVGTLMPGYTHLQHAQPVTLAHHLLAYVWMHQRDRERFADCFKRADVLPLGSGAIAGTSFPIDRKYVAELLGFSRISENSMDAVSDRDFVVEFLSAASITGMHLSRLAEELILWNTREFGFVKLDDSVATGSSLMPQKKNPDVPELIRGKAGRLFGNLMAMLTVLKGLPLTYNKDLQEDKEPLFDSADTLLACLPAMILLLENTEFQTEKMAEGLIGDFSTATDLADQLVRKGIPFRSAHEIVGRLVFYCEQHEKSLDSLTLEDLKSLPEEFGNIGPIGGPSESLEARDIPGGTAPGRIRDQIEAARKAVNRQ